MTASSSPLDDFGLPPIWRHSLIEGIAGANAASGTRLVVLDDDPLGGQALHDVPVLMTWQPALLAQELARSPVFLLVTNTRALTRPVAVERAREVGRALRDAEVLAGRRATPVWRSDSTLRGHFWWEMRALHQSLRGEAEEQPAVALLPYFGAGGRYTLNDVQYAVQEDRLTPVAETEFARDPVFGYQASHLPTWLEAHSEGSLPSASVTSVSNEDLRSGGPARVAEILSRIPGGGAVIVNAADDRDLEVFVAGLQVAESAGRRFLCSGAAPFVRVRAGQSPRPLLSAEELAMEAGAGGLTVVGSYAGRSSEQLALAVKLPSVDAFEVGGIEPSGAVAARVAASLAAGRDAVLHTSRHYEDGAPATTAAAITAVVTALDVRPRYLLAKGGSTAGTLATGALGVQRAVVLGQLLAGVPVWRLGDESRWPGLPFVVFAGNVGAPESLAEAITLLR